MMKKAFLVIYGLLLTGLCLAQKKTAATVLDVDRLYQKYKNREEVLVPLGNRTVRAHVYIAYNTLRQPVAIVLYGEANADIDNSMDNLLHDLENAKLKAGYKQVNTKANVVNFEQNNSYENGIRVSVFQKGTQYAKYGIKKAEDRQPAPVASADDIPAPRSISDSFYFEVGDMGRQQAVKVEKLEF